MRRAGAPSFRPAPSSAAGLARLRVEVTRLEDDADSPGSGTRIVCGDVLDVEHRLVGGDERLQLGAFVVLLTLLVDRVVKSRRQERDLIAVVLQGNPQSRLV